MPPHAMISAVVFPAARIARTRFNALLRDGMVSTAYRMKADTLGGGESNGRPSNVCAYLGLTYLCETFLGFACHRPSK